MSVRSYDIPAPRPRRDFSMTLAGLAGSLALLPFLIILMTVNGGYSVAGLEGLAAKFNNEGRIFWSVISSWTFAIDRAALLGLPVAQPVLPWAGVVGTNLLQIVLIYRKITGRKIPYWMWTLGILASIYDVSSTFVGVSTVGLLVDTWLPVRAVATGLITFLTESILGALFAFFFPKRG